MTKAPILRARHYAWITLAFVIFVIYGSLVPLTFRLVPFERAWTHFSWAFSKPITVAHRSDWAANVLLFTPLGFVGMGWLCVDRGRKPLAVGLLLIAFVALATLIEFAQIWFPPRDTSINDVAAETLGGAIGIGIWLVLGQSITDRVRRFWSTHAEGNWAIRLMPGYLVILVIVQGMPFDLTLSPSDLGRKYRAGRIQPIPFAQLSNEPIDFALNAGINFALFLPAGILIGGLPGWIAAGRNAAWRVFGLGLLLASAIEAMQLLVVSRSCDATDIITGSIAALIGWSLHLLWNGKR